MSVQYIGEGSVKTVKIEQNQLLENEVKMFFLQSQRQNAQNSCLPLLI